MVRIKKHRAAFICLLVTTLTILVFAFLHLPTNYLPQDTIILSPGQSFTDTKMGEANVVTFLYTKDMADKFEEYKIYQFVNHQTCKVYFDNKLKYIEKIKDDTRLDSLVKCGVWSSETSGEVMLEYTSHYNRYAKTVFPIYYGRHDAINHSFQMISAVKFVFFGLMLISFIIISVYVLLYLRRVEFLNYYIPIALFLLFSGIYVAIDTYSVSYLINYVPPGATSINPSISFSFWLHFMQYLMPVPLFLFAALQAKRTAKKTLVFTITYFTLLVILGAALDATKIIFLPDLGNFFGLGMISGSVALLYWSYTQRVHDSWTYTYFFGLLLIASIFDYSCYKLYLPVEDYRILKSLLMVVSTLWAVESIWRMFAVRDHLRMQRKITEIVTTNILENYEQLERHVQQVRKIKHDLANHYQSVLQLYSQGEHQKALQYLQKLSVAVAEVTPRRVQNILVDSIIYNKLTQSQNVRVEMDISVPRELPIEDSDVCSLLVNILDNALESCALCEQPWIIIKIITTKNQLFIYCKNSKCHSVLVENGLIRTSKTQRIGHGYGLTIIKSVVEKYDGVLCVDYDDESFTLDVVMPLV